MVSKGNMLEALKLHPKVAFLITEPWRYKVLYGGRAGIKSTSSADALLWKAYTKRTRVLETRMIQNTIRDSIHALLRDRIDALGLNKWFKVTENEITVPHNGSRFIFKGLSGSIGEIKSLEGIDICDVEEAHDVTDEMWEILIPTIRKPGSEIWVRFNTGTEDDPTYRRFVTNKPDNCKTVKVTYRDNPWLSEEIKEEIEHDKKLYGEGDEHFRNKWEGDPSGIGSRIYPIFNRLDDSKRPLHVRAFNFERILKGANCFMAMDPHTAYYPFAVWVARVPKGEKEYDYVVYNEFPTRGMMDGKYYHEVRKTRYCTLTMKQLATMIYTLDNTIDRTYQVKIRARGIDTRFAAASGARSWSTNTEGMIVEFSHPENGGLNFETPPVRHIDVQRDKIRGLLDYNIMLPVTELNEPHLYVMPHCQNVIVALENHRFAKDKVTEDEKYKDPCDALRILFAIMDEYKHEYPDETAKAVVNQERGAIDELRETFIGPSFGYRQDEERGILVR